MKQSMRGVGLILLLSLFLSAFTVFAQEEDDSLNDDFFTISGSRVALDAISTVATANDQSVDVNITGTNTGFQLLCSGQAAAVGAIRPMSITEEENCLLNGVSYNEYLIGYNVLAFVTHSDLSFASCLTPEQVSQLFSPSSQGVVTDWAQIGLNTPQSVPLTVILPPENSIIYGLLDEQIEGFGLREDAQNAADSQAMIDAVRNTEGAIGIVPLSAVTEDDSLQIVELINTDLGRCIAPSLETTESGEYTLRNQMLLYVNTAQVSTDAPLLTLITSVESAEALVDAGYTAPSEDAYARNQAVLTGEAGEGRQFTRDLVAFEIPVDLFGQFSIGGSAYLAAYISSTTGVFNSDYPGVSPIVTVDGQVASIRRFCNGELDVIALNRELTEEELTSCQNNTVQPITFSIGAQAAVLVANDNLDEGFPACLTREQVQGIWAQQTEPPTNWSQIDASFPDADLILVAPDIGQVDYIDILLTTDSGASLPERLNVAERRNDPAYRAAAVGNVVSGLTFMSWIDYENLEDVRPENIRLVAISDGSDCVEPSLQTIRDGSYPYALEGNLIVNQSALVRPEVQGFVWYLFQDANYYLYAATGLTGLQFGDLPDIREALQETFTQASLVSITPTFTGELPPRNFGPQVPFDLLATETP